jgi:tetratricopeptide (TPR) repeat protein
MRFNIKNPWVVGILGGVVAVIVGGIILHYTFEYPKQKALEAVVKTSINNADSLLDNNMTEEALTIYNDLLKVALSKKEVYGYINNQRGICYYNLAMLKDTEENITRAIQAYEEALKIYTVEKYAVAYAETQHNLERAKHQLKTD